MPPMTEEERKAFDLYAAAALQGLLANPDLYTNSPERMELVRHMAILYARDMLKLRASALRHLATTPKRADVTAKSKPRARAH